MSLIFCLAILIFDCSCRGKPKKCVVVSWWVFIGTPSNKRNLGGLISPHLALFSPSLEAPVTTWCCGCCGCCGCCCCCCCSCCLTCKRYWLTYRLTYRLTYLLTDLPCWLSYLHTYCLPHWLTNTWIIIGLTQWLTYSHTYVLACVHTHKLPYLLYTYWLRCVPALLACLVTKWETDLLHFLTYTLAYLLADVPTYLLTYRPPYGLTCLPHLLF